MIVLMKHAGTPQHCHPVDTGMLPLCGFSYDSHAWGCFDVPREMLSVLPICGVCSRVMHPHADELQARCAALGWSLSVCGVEYELEGNGSVAGFTSEASLIVWLERHGAR